MFIKLEKQRACVLEGFLTSPKNQLPETLSSRAASWVDCPCWLALGTFSKKVSQFDYLGGILKTPISLFNFDYLANGAFAICRRTGTSQVYSIPEEISRLITCQEWEGLFAKAQKNVWRATFPNKR